MTEKAMAEFDRAIVVSADLPWEEYLRGYFTAFREVLRGNSLWCDLIVMRAGVLSPEATRIAKQRIDLVLQTLVRAGFSPGNALLAYTTLSVYARGAVFLDRNRKSLDGLGVRANADTDVPGLTVLPPTGTVDDLTMTGDHAFGFGLDNAIRGLKALLQSGAHEVPFVAASGSSAASALDI
jgi:hypothetical protein